MFGQSQKDIPIFTEAYMQPTGGLLKMYKRDYIKSP